MTLAVHSRPQRALERFFRSPYLCYGLLLVMILLFAGIRYNLRAMPLERDEGEYAYAGQLMLQGVPPYQLAYSMKLPGTYAAYALILAVFGQTSSGVHLGLLLVNAASVLMIYLLAAHLFDRLAGIVAAASFAVLSTSASVLGFAAHATHFVVLAMLAGVLLLLRALESGRSWLFLSSGLLMGIAFLMKQHGIAFVLFGLTYLLKCELSRPIHWRALATRAGSYLLGAALPFAVTCLLMYRAGVFRTFLFWTFGYAHEYAANVTASEVWPILHRSLVLLLLPQVLIWCFALAGLAAICRHSTRHRFFLGSLLLFSGLAVCPGLRFRLHYFVLLLPAVALLAGLAVSATAKNLYERTASWKLAMVPAVFFVLALALTIFHQRALLFGMDPVTASQAMYGVTPFLKAEEIGRHIECETSPADRVAVFGSEPEIYFYAHRHSATGYIYTYPVMDSAQYARGMQENMIREVSAAHPQVAVFVRSADSWAETPIRETLLTDWMGHELDEQYSLLGIVDLTDPPTSHWDADAAGYRPKSHEAMFIYRRRTQ